MAKRARPLAVEFRPAAALVPYAKNARMHSEAQIAQIAASMLEFGWTNPVLVDAKGGIIAGHGRVLASEGIWADGKSIRNIPDRQVPTITLAHLTEAQRRAYVIADNQLPLNAAWNPELLRLELGELKLEGFDLALLGFGDGLGKLMAPAGLMEPDAAPPLPEAPVSRLGDTWACGAHRVRCGDATSAEDVAALLGSTRPLLMVTDPPYGVEYDPNWRNEASRNGSLVHTIGATAIGRVANDERADWTEAWSLFAGDVAYVWHGGRHAEAVSRSLGETGFVPRAQIIWNKDRLIIGRGDYHWKHEPCWYAVRKGKRGHWSGDRTQSTVWDIAHRASDTGHSTQKPVECMRRPIANHAAPEVYDPFLGSGTTMIAAEMEGRACYGMEIAPQYVDVAVIRWQNFTGEEATLNAGGPTFADVAKVRGEKPKRRRRIAEPHPAEAPQ